MNVSVSVIVPVHNPGAEFTETLNSILQQTQKPLEVIIINDASTEGLNLIAECAKHPSVLLLNLEKNVGGGGARNIGLAQATGKYVAFCDSDDIWPAEKLATQIAFMENGNYAITHTDIAIHTEDHDQSTVVVTPSEIDLERFLTTTSIYCSTACVRRDSVDNAKFAERAIRHPFKFWVSLLERDLVSVRVPGINVTYKYRANSVSSRTWKTFCYTIYAYAIDPKDKLLALRCLWLRFFYALTGYSRIKQGILK